jgi:putative flippase GtrA
MGNGRLSRFIPYTGVGAVGTACQFVVLFILVRTGTTSASIGSGVGAVAGALTNYLLNYSFTFSGRASHSHAFPRFAAVASLSAVLNGSIMLALTTWIQIQYLVAQVFTTAFLLALTFGLNSMWSFRAVLRDPH